MSIRKERIRERDGERGNVGGGLLNLPHAG